MEKNHTIPQFLHVFFSYLWDKVGKNKSLMTRNKMSAVKFTANFCTQNHVVCFYDRIVGF